MHKLTREILQEIANFADIKAVLSLRKTCKIYSSLFLSDTDTMKPFIEWAKLAQFEYGPISLDSSAKNSSKAYSEESKIIRNLKNYLVTNNFGYWLLTKISKQLADCMKKKSFEVKTIIEGFYHNAGEAKQHEAFLIFSTFQTEYPELTDFFIGFATACGLKQDARSLIAGYTLEEKSILNSRNAW